MLRGLQQFHRLGSTSAHDHAHAHPHACTSKCAYALALSLSLNIYLNASYAVSLSAGPATLTALLPLATRSVPYISAHYYYYFYLYFTSCCCCCCKHVKYFLFVCNSSSSHHFEPANCICMWCVCICVCMCVCGGQFMLWSRTLRPLPPLWRSCSQQTSTGSPSIAVMRLLLSRVLLLLLPIYFYLSL